MKLWHSHSTILTVAVFCLSVAAMSRWFDNWSDGADGFNSQPPLGVLPRKTAFQDIQPISAGGQPDSHPFSFSESAVTCVLPKIRGGSLVLIGSTDTNAGLHSIRIKADGSKQSHAETAAELVPEFYRACDVYENITTTDNRDHHQVDWTRINPAKHDLTMELQSRDASSIPPSCRRFLAPIFSSDTASCRPLNAKLMAYSQQVAVYADDSLHSDHGADVGQVESAAVAVENTKRYLKAVEVCSITEQLLPILVSSLGEIVDFDEDGRVTFLMTTLNQAPGEAGPVMNNGPPIQGCVRRHDFTFRGDSANPVEAGHNANPLSAGNIGRQYGFHRSSPATSDYGGDIVYLDWNLPHADDLAALLMHELTHAAVYSMEPSSGVAFNPPVWLNESFAHLMELSVSGNSANYRDRWALYTAATHLHPVVIPSHGTTLATRRGGSRIAGTEFLRSMNPDRNELRRLITAGSNIEQCIEDVFGISFDRAFRRWCILQATNLKLPAAGGKVQHASLAAMESAAIASSTSWPEMAASDRSFRAGRLLDQSDNVHRPMLQTPSITDSGCLWQLRGTAFLCLHTDQEVTGLTIRASRKARLQVTIIDGAF